MLRYKITLFLIVFCLVFTSVCAAWADSQNHVIFVITTKYQTPSRIIKLIHWDSPENLPAGVISISSNDNQHIIKCKSTPGAYRMVKQTIELIDVPTRKVDLTIRIIAIPKNVFSGVRVDPKIDNLLAQFKSMAAQLGIPKNSKNKERWLLKHASKFVAVPIENPIENNQTILIDHFGNRNKNGNSQSIISVTPHILDKGFAFSITANPKIMAKELGVTAPAAVDKFIDNNLPFRVFGETLCFPCCNMMRTPKQNSAVDEYLFILVTVNKRSN